MLATVGTTDRSAEPGPAAAKLAARARGRAARAALGQGHRRAAAAAIANRLAGLVAERGADDIGLYAATADEVDLDVLRDRWLAEGRRVALPRTTGPSAMVFHLVTGPPTTTGRFGIAEPDRTAPVAATLDLVVVPGVAFDPRGGRVGQGAGFYDRWLAATQPRPFTVGVCFAAQLVEEVPRERHDIDLDAVVTEDAVLLGGLRYR
jgi:5-formyltetrahydrofolate cyclo-ligase